jgi:archaellum biogenesis ATPase FlaH
VDYPRHLISHTVKTGDIATALDAGIRPEWIADFEAGRVWRYLVEYQAKYGKPPSSEVLSAEYPTYTLLTEPEPIGYVVDKLRSMRAMAMLEASLDQAVGYLERSDVDGVQAELSSVLAALAAELPRTTDVDITQTGAARMERYIAAGKRDGAMVGIPTGFERLNEALGGFRPEQLIVMVGPPKAGKSTLLLVAALAAHAAYKKPLLVGFEMSGVEQEERIDALRAHVSANDLRDGRLNPTDLRKVERVTRQMEAMVPFWLSTDTTASSTLSGLVAKAQQLKPDILLVDGVYMMADEQGEKPNSPQALTNISRGFKRAGQALKIPIVITTQVLLSKMIGGEVTVQSIGYSSAFGQDADAVIAVEPTREHDIFKVKYLMGRTVAPFSFFVRRDWKGGYITELAYDPFGEEDFAEDDLVDARF